MPIVVILVILSCGLAPQHMNNRKHQNCGSGLFPQRHQGRKSGLFPQTIEGYLKLDLQTFKALLKRPPKVYICL